MQFYSISASEKLNNIPVEAGNVIWDQIERCMYVDSIINPEESDEVERLTYQQIITLETELARTSLAIPIRGFYFIKETCCLWNYDGNSWRVIVIPTENNQIVFEEREDFPEVGNSNVLYIAGTDIFRWIDGEYKLINGSTSHQIVWVEI